jgi:hypothetical protein
MPLTTTDFPVKLYQDLVTEFLAELMLATQDEPTQDAFQRATQAYCDSLRPWLEPGDCPTPARAVFPLFEDYTWHCQLVRPPHSVSKLRHEHTARHHKI